MSFSRLIAVSLLLGFGQAPANTATIDGVVINSATSAPVAGVLITARMPSLGTNAVPPPVPTTQDTFGRTVMQVMTGADGRFSIRVPAGRAEIVFGKDLYGIRTLTYTTTAGQYLQNAVVRLAPTGVITGRVIDANNKPVPAAVVTPIFYRYTNRGKELARYPGARTNDRGDFRLSNLPSNAYILSIAGSNTRVLYPGVAELSMAENVQVESGQEMKLRDVVLSGTVSGGTLRVNLINGAGEPAKDVTYSFIDATPSLLDPGLDGNSLMEVPEISSREAPVHLEPSQTWTSEHVLSGIGRYRASARWTDSSGSVVTTTAFADSTGAKAELNLFLTNPNGRVSCRSMVQENDGTLKPIPSITISITGPVSSFCRTAVDGTSVISSLPAGKFKLNGFQGIPLDSYVASAKAGGQDALHNGFDVTSNHVELEIHIRQGAAKVQGRITDRQGRAVHDAAVVAVPDLSVAGSIMDAPYPSSRTDQNGVFQLRGLRPGTYRLYAWSLLDDAALQNPMFLKKWEGRGVEVVVQERGEVLKDLIVVDEPQ